MKKVKKVKVRIAVAVGPNGAWTSAGWTNISGKPTKDDDLLGNVYESGCDFGEVKLYFVEAELDCPEVSVVQAVAAEVKPCSS